MSFLRAPSLRTKFAVPVSALFAAVAVFVFAYFPWRLERETTSSLKERAAGLASTTAYSLRLALIFENVEAAREVLEAARRSQDLVFAVVETKTGGVFVADDLEAAHRAGYEAATVEGGLGAGGAVFMVRRLVGSTGTALGAVVVGLSFEPARREIREGQIVGALVGLLILLFGIGTVFGVSTLVTVPLRGVVETAERVSRGDLTGRASVTSRDEVGALAESFNRMVTNLATAYEKLEESHRGLERRVEERTAALQRSQVLERDRNQVLERIARGEPLASTLAGVAHLVEDQFPEGHGAVFLVRDGRLLLASGPSLSDGANAALRERPLLDQSSPLARAARERRPVRVPSEPAGEDGAGEYSGLVAVPLLSRRGSALGVLALLFPEAASARGGEEGLMEGAASLAVVAIEQRQLRDRLSHQAHHDMLTGLPNRLLFEDRLQQALMRARRGGTHVALLYIDLDRFKHVNDTLGHAAGDALLALVSRQLLGAVRQGDTLARMGGDEFTLVLSDLQDPGHALLVGWKLLESLREPIQVQDQEIFVTASIGVSIFPLDAADATTLQINSDSAMYRVKDRGGNGVEGFAPELGGLGGERLRLEASLRHAVEREELELDFQPQVDLAGRLVGVESLVRWNHPELGRILPGAFIGVAEESGAILEIGAWVLDEACRAAARWAEATGRFLPVAVNLSPLQFRQKGLVEGVEAVLKAHGLPRGVLQLELTESLVIRDVPGAAIALERLKAAGVLLAIDDFGTGYSSLAYLQRLPIDLLKIDQTFIRDIGSGHEGGLRSAKLVQTIVTLGHALGLDVMAEGVETKKQLDFLKTVGCDKAQGFLFHRPLPAGAVEALLRAYTPPAPAV